jgi:hypothetical protein
MASAKQFLGNTCASNKKIAAQIKGGSKVKITACEVKQAAVTKDECLGIQVTGSEMWIRINSTNNHRLSQKYGDDTDKWIGKTITIQWGQDAVNGVMQTSLHITPH